MGRAEVIWVLGAFFGQRLPKMHLKLCFSLQFATLGLSSVFAGSARGKKRHIYDWKVKHKGDVLCLFSASELYFGLLRK